MSSKTPLRSSGTKIIIPRRARREPTPEPEPEPSEPEQSTQEDEGDGDEEGQADDDEQGQGGEDGSEEGDGDSQVQGEDDDASQREDASAVGDAEQPTRARGRGRGRGRPRGRGRGGRGLSTGRPRGRPRGSGRGRGRGRGRGTSATVTLRLPKRVGDSDGDGAEGGEGDDSQVETPAADDEPVEIPGGGKPFRMVQGKAYVIEGDEFITEEDEKGNTKIDEFGNLLGGRVFKAGTFILPQRHPERRYMLAIDAARTSGFRDSLYYFRKNHLAFKLNASQSEKDMLIEQGKLGSHLRTRSVTLITARSAYKLHGSKMIVDGKLVVDDYYEEKALADITARGLKPGDPVTDLIEQEALQAAENSAIAALNKAANNPNKAERSGLGIYRTGGPTTVFGGTGLGPFSDGPIHVAKRAMLNREGANEETWMKVMAERTRDANSDWTKGRAESLRPLGGLLSGDKERARDETMDVDGAEAQRDSITSLYPIGMYEPHTGIVHYRNDTQPSRAHWERAPGSSTNRRVLGGTKVGNAAWGLAWVDTVMELPDHNKNDDYARSRQSLWEAIGMA